MGPLDVKDLFNIDDLSPIDKLISKTDQLIKSYDGVVDSAEVNSKRFSAALQDVVDQAGKLEQSLMGIDSSVKSNQKTLSQAAASVDSLAKAQMELKSAQEANMAILVQAKTQHEKLTIVRDKAVKTSLEERIATQENNKIAKLNIRVKNAQENSVEQLRAKLSLAKIEWAQLSQEERENTQAGKVLEKQLSDLNEEVKSVEKNVGITSRSVGDYTNSIVEAAGKINPLQVGTAGFGSALQGVAGSIPQLAAVGAAVGGIAIAMDELQELTEEVKIQLKDVSDLTGETGNNLLDLTAGIRATADTFEQDFNEVLRTGNVLSKEFGISQQEALDIVNEGLIRGANVGGDFLDQISEYSTQFKRAGLDARGLLNTIDFSIKQGIFSDKGPDLIKEAGLRLSELTTSASDALKPLGEVTNQQIRAAVAAGDNFEALKITAKGLEDVNLSAQEVQTIVADVFGGAGEDAGLRFISLLGDIDQGYKLTSESATEYQKSQIALLEAEQALSSAQVEVGNTLKGASSGYKTLGLNIQAFALRYFLLLLEAVRPIRDQFLEIGDLIGDLVKALGFTNKEGKSTISLFDALSATLKITIFPIRLILTLIGSMIEVFASLARQSGFFSKSVDEGAESVSLFSKVLENLPFILAGFLAAFRQTFSSIKDIIISTFGNAKDIIQGAFTFDFKQLERGISNIKKPFNKAGKDITKAFFDGFKTERERSLREREEALKESNENVLQEQRKFANKASAEDIAAAKKRADALKKAQFELNKFRISEEIRALDEIAANQDIVLSSRLRALSDAADKRIDLAMMERDELLRQEGLTSAGRQLILEKFQSQLQKIESDADLAIEVTITADQKRTEENLKKTLSETLSQRIGEANIMLANELSAANKAFRDGEISLQEFEQRKLDIQRQFNEERLKDQIAFFENQLQLLNLSKSDRIAIEDKVAQAKLALVEKSNEDLIARETELQEALKDLKQVAFDGALTVIDNLNEAEDLKRERDLEKLEEQRELELEGVGNNEEAKAAINAKFDQQKQDIDAKQAKADRKRAIFDKALAATTIGIETALAVVKSVRASPLTGGLPFSAIVAAIGAIQLAAVLTQPIPQFYKGTTNAPEGWAILTEQGPELVKEPDGKRWMAYSDGPTYHYLKGGSTVYTASETERIMENEAFEGFNKSFFNDRISNNAMTIDNRSVVIAVKEMGENIEDAIEKIPGTIYDERGIRQYFVSKNNQIDKINDRYGV